MATSAEELVALELELLLPLHPLLHLATSSFCLAPLPMISAYLKYGRDAA